MRHFLLIHFNKKPQHVSSRLAAHHQEDQLRINSNWYSHALYWLAVGQQPVNIRYDYTNCCLYTFDPPDDDDERQACSKHVETYYWNKVIENGASCCYYMDITFNFVYLLQRRNHILMRKLLCCLWRDHSLTLLLLTWRIWWATNNASKWQMGSNSAFKRLIHAENLGIW